MPEEDSDPLKLQLMVVVNMHMWKLEEPNSDPLQEQYMVLTVELFLQPQLPSHLIISL